MLPSLPQRRPKAPRVPGLVLKLATPSRTINHKIENTAPVTSTKTSSYYPSPPPSSSLSHLEALFTPSASPRFSFIPGLPDTPTVRGHQPDTPPPSGSGLKRFIRAAQSARALTPKRSLPGRGFTNGSGEITPPLTPKTPLMMLQEEKEIPREILREVKRGQVVQVDARLWVVVAPVEGVCGSFEEEEDEMDTD